MALIFKRNKVLALIREDVTLIKREFFNYAEMRKILKAGHIYYITLSNYLTFLSLIKEAVILFHGYDGECLSCHYLAIPISKNVSFFDQNPLDRKEIIPLDRVKGYQELQITDLPLYISWLVSPKYTELIKK